ncbi:CobW family GTP-binding protein [Thetidibacter halocola]|uniref:GTP-binding protein n=1 Tax=Thetidibacter halocola TaxID=2827239 RepID=A0A8J7W9H2_9RHOB|nr:GTP-binding protein [Thetidibacter halocola]MBS0122697.1 GTP-binding protein [Thetidibacter halocola]
MTEAEGRLRLTILGGYLGAGKTTWLRHALYEGRFGKAHVIVNEAAEIPVDDAFLRSSGEVTVLAGGCVCCTARADLIAALRGLCDARSRAGAVRLDTVVLETSGLADPAPIAEAIRADPVLTRHILLDEIIVLVDGLHGAAQLASDPLGRHQIEAADRLILTKPDAAPDLNRLRATLARLNPGAEVTAAAHGVDWPLPPLPAGVLPMDLVETGDVAPPVPVPVALPEGMDWSPFSVWLSALLHVHGDRIVRVKGVVRTPAGRLLLQGVRRTVQSPEILPDPGAPTDDTLVLIGRDIDADRVRRSLQKLV